MAQFPQRDYVSHCLAGDRRDINRSHGDVVSISVVLRFTTARRTIAAAAAAAAESLTNDGRAADAALQTLTNDGMPPDPCFVNARN